MTGGAVCPTCGRAGWDPVGELQTRLASEDRFVQVHPVVRCPNCKKRARLRLDSITLDHDPARFHCRHCDTVFEVAHDANAEPVSLGLHAEVYR